ncbi:hypothetical protein EJ04DRAFT_517892 [Polyplosphaeria fusca]|uniref:Uncharacterized protein n=1 Tax=Polyplosphaeria fusca TaxID=682080 RepID=A0A9P4RBZ8_9PLEO|nr:hypothetical protein EJ04DRAFT_517892 [Polyplosphaeria fusca]
MAAALNRKYPPQPTMLPPQRTPHDLDLDPKPLSPNFCIEAPTTPNLMLRQPEHCSHYFHPGGPQTHFLCPACSTHGKLDALLRVTALWQRHGGPSTQTYADSRVYVQARECYYAAKTTLIKYVLTLERNAELERRWEEANPELVELVRGNEGVRSAGETLVDVRRRTPFVEWEEVVVVVEKKSGKGKKVSWDEGVVEFPRRAKEEYWRRMEKYEPGRWASEDGEGWLDTSFALDDTFGQEEREMGSDQEFEDVPSTDPNEGE